MDTGNYATQLNEYVQRTRSVQHYEDLGSVGPDHNKTFIQRVVLNGKVYPDGSGKTKKAAKHNAAENALKCLFGNTLQDPADSTNSAEAPAASVHRTSMSDINYICWLNEYGQKNRLTVTAVPSTRLGQNKAVPCCSFVVGDKQYPAVSGKTEREAKEEAAKLVYDIICGSTTETAGEIYNCASVQPQEDLNQNVFDICDKIKGLDVNTEGGSFTETNFIGIVNHYCQKTKRSHTFIEERRCGPPHNPQFFYKLVIDNKEYPVGEGKNVKEAKQNAAQLAWSALQEQSDWDSKVSFRSTVSEDGAPPTSQNPSESSSQSMPVTSGSTVSENDLPSSFSTQPSLDTVAPSSHGTATGTSDGIIFADSSNSTKDQAAVKNNNMGKGVSNASTQSRFTSEFDSIKCLGEGGFGHVYKVREKLLDKYYAVKIVRGKKKALREVVALSDLHHHNIVRYYNCWMEDSAYIQDSSADSCSTSQSVSNSSPQYLYIKMELCETKTLKGWIDERNEITLHDSKRREESLTIAQQIVSGVEYIHSKKLIHRDLKPANIMFGQVGEVKIGDFGLVTAENDDDEENLMERTRRTGTLSYMAPEQRSEKTYDRKVDIFSLGLIYFELLWKLSSGHERVVILRDVRGRKFPEQFSLTFSRENQIIKSMLWLEPGHRPEARALRAELENWAQILKKQKNTPQQNVTV
ncbi:interferon-induced, double-stranded RNA-activated protein kinase-like isoform X2 [Xiphias gladius]|uniref:interferon-induced, double-stranded RNA-activated protein kinase-like isoform X2 n=1 Tax=Xiphias gladius TaxID=8245 RepID=UPI001A98BF8D|nr:interferon-induced, double-stranded RNA-activated protein kinase-like isoform X2 [Xiphias gladius]